MSHIRAISFPFRYMLLYSWQCFWSCSQFVNLCSICTLFIPSMRGKVFLAVLLSLFSSLSHFCCKGRLLFIISSLGVNLKLLPISSLPPNGPMGCQQWSPVPFVWQATLNLPSLSCCSLPGDSPEPLVVRFVIVTATLSTFQFHFWLVTEPWWPTGILWFPQISVFHGFVGT